MERFEMIDFTFEFLEAVQAIRGELARADIFQNGTVGLAFMLAIGEAAARSQLGNFGKSVEQSFVTFPQLNFAQAGRIDD